MRQMDAASVYIAGPMTGLPGFNFAAFDEARDRLAATGYIVYSPADVSRNFGVDPLLPADLVDEYMVQQLMRIDISLVMEADVVVMLPGWEHSRDARCKASVARAIGTPVVDCDMNEIDLLVLDEVIDRWRLE